MQLRKAERKRQHLRIALCSPPGAGKTFSALRIAHALGGPVGVIDTENGSAELYAGEANPDGGAFEFVTIDLAQEPGKFSTENYIEALHAMHRAGVQTVVVDSGSHAWAGEGGLLEMVDAKGKGGNKFTAWADATPKHNAWIQALLTYPGHLVMTLRTKMEHVQEKDASGRTTIRKVGMAPIQRDGLEYEFTVVGELDVDTHRLMITKSRCSALADRSFVKPGADVAKVLLAWLEGGAPEASRPPVEPKNVRTDNERHQAGERIDPMDGLAPVPRDDFADAVLRMGLNVHLVAGFCESIGRPHPDRMDSAQRESLTRWLGTDDGRLRYDNYAVERAETEARDVQ